MASRAIIRRSQTHVYELRKLMPYSVLGTEYFLQAGDVVVHRRQHNRSLFARTALVGIVLVLTCVLSAFAQPAMLQESLVDLDNSQPIHVTADHIAIWNDGDLRMLILKDGAVISQGESTIRTPSGVVWIDKQRTSAGVVFTVTVYGEEPIQLERQTKAEATYGYVRLRTTSDRIRIQAFKTPMKEANLAHQPLYQRALARKAIGCRPGGSAAVCIPADRADRGGDTPGVGASASVAEHSATASG
jgi:hypothetical protein